jgi:phage FluMu gp28-like protein
MTTALMNPVKTVTVKLDGATQECDWQNDPLFTELRLGDADGETRAHGDRMVAFCNTYLASAQIAESIAETALSKSCSLHMSWANGAYYAVIVGPGCGGR